MSSLTNLLGDVDATAIAVPNDKLRECEFFYSLAAEEVERDKFRWLISAFLNASYSYLEIKAKYLCQRYYDPKSDELIPDEESLAILRKYVRVSQNKNNPDFIKTQGLHDLIKGIYKHRNENTHHYPISITQRGSSFPEDYCIGYRSENAIPALALCREVLNLLRALDANL